MKRTIQTFILNVYMFRYYLHLVDILSIDLHIMYLSYNYIGTRKKYKEQQEEDKASVTD